MRPRLRPRTAGPSPQLIDEAGVASWVLGSVTTLGTDATVEGFGPIDDLSADSSGVRLISGTKGVQAGAVLLHGEYRVG